MSDEREGPDGGDLNELDRDAAHFEATHDGADWTDVEPAPGGTGEAPGLVPYTLDEFSDPAPF
jgi:hypothetical protein